MPRDNVSTAWNRPVDERALRACGDSLRRGGAPAALSRERGPDRRGPVGSARRAADDDRPAKRQAPHRSTLLDARRRRRDRHRLVRRARPSARVVTQPGGESERGARGRAQAPPRRRANGRTGGARSALGGGDGEGARLPRVRAANEARDPGGDPRAPAVAGYARVRRATATASRRVLTPRARSRCRTWLRTVSVLMWRSSAICLVERPCSRWASTSA